MSNAYNHATLAGNICDEPKYVTTQSGFAKVSFRIGVQRRFKDKETGQKKADFVNVIAWRNTAEFVRQYCRKGDFVVVDGEIQSRSYDAQDGTKRYVTEINAEDVRRPYQKASEGTVATSSGAYAPPSPEGDGFEEVLDEDLPF